MRVAAKGWVPLLRLKYLKEQKMWRHFCLANLPHRWSKPALNVCPFYTCEVTRKRKLEEDLNHWELGKVDHCFLKRKIKATTLLYFPYLILFIHASGIFIICPTSYYTWLFDSLCRTVYLSDSRRPFIWPSYGVVTSTHADSFKRITPAVVTEAGIFSNEEYLFFFFSQNRLSVFVLDLMFQC